MINDLKSVLGAMADELPGFAASAAVLADDGLAIAALSRSADIDPDAISAHMTSIVQSNLKALKIVGDGQITKDILITTSDYYFLIRQVPDKPYFFFVTTHRSEWLGRTRLVMQKYEKDIVRLLG